MNKIFIEDMEFFAFHGHYPEEKHAGNKFYVSIWLWTDTEAAEISDDINDALNYQEVYAIICDIMRNTKSNLVENLAANILNATNKKFPNLKKAKVKISKINPPMGGKIGAVGVEIEKNF